jgi:hypothetical protein
MAKLSLAMTTALPRSTSFGITALTTACFYQHFRQASFSEFEMLMGLDDEVLKRYGLPNPTVKRALLEVSLIVQRIVLRALHDYLPVPRIGCKA